MTRVVDTDVVSYLYKGDSRAALYYPHLFGQVLVVSFQTVAELRRWTLSAKWGARRLRHLESRLQRYVVEHSSDALCVLWAEAMESAKRNGRPVAPADAWVAATALYLDVPLVTNNRDDFLGIDGLTVISERAP
jgi:predicted nucleic acid-binding protein